MVQAPSRSAGVTAAATYALLCCVTVFLFWGYIFVVAVNARADDQGRHLYETYTFSFLLVTLAPPLVVALGIRTAIGLLQLRPWARVGAILWASLSLILCLALIALHPFETFVIPNRFVHEAVLYRQLAAVSFLVMLFPASVWWLFYFRAKRVKQQFLSADSEGMVNRRSVAERI